MAEKFFWWEKDGLKVLKSALFEETRLVQHGFSTRLGGMSGAPYTSLNLAFHVGDDPNHVLQNRERLSKALNFTLDDWVAGEQVHGTDIAVVRATDRGKGAREQQSAFAASDALMTNVPGIVLTTYAADCVSILLLDPVKKVIAAVHAGWKGTVAKILPKTLSKMADVYGTDPQDCLAAIGPAIGPACFEVDEKILALWQERFDFWREVSRASENCGKYYLDLWQTNQRQLLASGLRPAKIVVAEFSTMAHVDVWYSYRKEGGKTGRHVACIMLTS